MRQTLRLRAFGTGRLELLEVPAAIGHGLAGTVVLDRDLSDVTTIEAELACLKRVRSGRNNETRSTVVWQERTTVPADRRRSGGGSTRIDLRLPIPKDATPSTAGRESVGHHWRVRVLAERPGVDLDMAFEVPVFRTDRAVDDTFEREHRERVTEREPGRRSTFRWEESDEGLAVEFPAFRHRGLALGVLGFTAVWTAIFVLLVRADVPWVLTGVFGLFTLLLWAISAGVAATRRTLWVDGTELVVHRRVLVWSRTRFVPAEEVEDIDLHIGMTQNETPYHDLRLRLRDGSHVTVASLIKDPAEARWLASRILARVRGEIPTDRWYNRPGEEGADDVLSGV